MSGFMHLAFTLIRDKACLKFSETPELSFAAFEPVLQAISRSCWSATVADGMKSSIVRASAETETPASDCGA